jgi:hypothetical protein
MPATVGIATTIFTITDGLQGDDDLAANGTIVDQGGPGVPPAGAGVAQTPTLSEWALLLLIMMMLASGAFGGMRHAGRSRR